MTRARLTSLHHGLALGYWKCNLLKVMPERDSLTHAASVYISYLQLGQAAEVAAAAAQSVFEIHGMSMKVGGNYDGKNKPHLIGNHHQQRDFHSSRWSACESTIVSLHLISTLTLSQLSTMYVCLKRPRKLNPFFRLSPKIDFAWPKLHSSH